MVSKGFKCPVLQFCQILLPNSWLDQTENGDGEPLTVTEHGPFFEPKISGQSKVHDPTELYLLTIFPRIILRIIQTESILVDKKRDGGHP